MSEVGTYKEGGMETPTKLKMSKLLSWAFYAWAVFGVGTLLLRVFLLVTSANMTTSFTAFIARTSSNYLQPFYGIFPQQNVTDTGYLDVSALFAAIVYLFLAWSFMEVINYVQGNIDRSRVKQHEYQLRQSATLDNTRRSSKNR